MPKSRRVNFGALCVLCLMFLILVSGLRLNALTADEPAHITMGYLFLARGQQALWVPPEYRTQLFANALSALPLYLSQPHIAVEALPGWDNVFPQLFPAFVSVSDFSMGQLQVLARIPTVFLTLVGGALTFRWAKELFGQEAGLLALIFWAFDPNLLAHGRLATTDMSVTVLGTLALYCVWRWTQTPTRWLTFISALSLGGVLLSKPSGIIWGGFVALVIFNPLRLCRGRQGSLHNIFSGAGILFGSGLLLWAAYGFTCGHISATSILVPAPLYWDGVLNQTRIADIRWVYAWGYRGYERFGWYFPAAFLVKTPLPFLLLLGSSPFVLFRRLPQPRLAMGMLFALIYAGIAITTGPNIGYRHLLPLQPFFCILVGGAGWQWLRGGNAGWWLRWALMAVCIGWHITGTLRLWPNELTFFNALIGGSDKGYLYLVDSNLDWGQMSAETVAEVARRYTDVQPAPPIRRWRPHPGHYLITASALQGLSESGPFAYEWFRHSEPEAIIQHTLLVYRVAHFDVAWFAQCAAPAAPLASETVLKEMGTANLRLLAFDCQQTWVYPPGFGIYGLSYDLYQSPRPTGRTLIAGEPRPQDAFMAAHLENTRLSFDKLHADSLPRFVLHELTRHADGPAMSYAYASPASIPPANLPQTEPLTLPVNIGDGFLALGATFHSEERQLEVETWWQNNQGAIHRPFSMMAHLVSSDGTVIDVADGLGVSPLMLRPGDIVVQRHRFELPASTQPELWLRTGIYWLDTMTRWEIDSHTDYDALYMPVPVRRKCWW